MMADDKSTSQSRTPSPAGLADLSSSGQQVPTQQIPTEQIPTQQVPAQQVPAQQLPTQQAPAQQPPPEETSSLYSLPNTFTGFIWEVLMGSATTESSSSIDKDVDKEMIVEQSPSTVATTTTTTSSSPGRNRSGTSPTRTPTKIDPLTLNIRSDQHHLYPEPGVFSPSSTDTLRSVPLPAFSPLASVLKEHPEVGGPLSVRETVQRYETAAVGRANGKVSISQGKDTPLREGIPEQDRTLRLEDASAYPDDLSTMEPASDASREEQPVKEPLHPTRSMMDSISYWTSAVIGAVNPLGAYDNEIVDEGEHIQARPPSVQPQDTSLDDLSPITLSGRNDDEVELKVMTREIAEQLRVHFPRRYRFSSKWTLVYSLEQHGISMSSLYYKLQRHCEEMYGAPGGSCPSILVLQDAEGGVFGAFVTEAWRPNSGSGTAKEHQGMFTGEGRTTSSSSLFAGSVARGRSFYGSGECFLFNWDTSVNTLQAYTWSHKNDYFMLSEQDFMAMGGGEGKFSLYIDGDLYRGHSAPAPTFSNQRPICKSADGNFVCVALEVWAFLDD